MDQILTDAKREDQLATVKAWYDGYHFGEFDIYCPWDVMNYVSRLQTDPSARPAGYWKNTSDNAIIRSFIDMKSDMITRKIFIMLFWRESLPEPDVYLYGERVGKAERGTAAGTVFDWGTFLKFE